MTPIEVFFTIPIAIVSLLPIIAVMWVLWNIIRDEDWVVLTFSIVFIIFMIWLGFAITYFKNAGM